MITHSNLTQCITILSIITHSITTHSKIATVDSIISLLGQIIRSKNSSELMQESFILQNLLHKSLLLYKMEVSGRAII